MNNYINIQVKYNGLRFVCTAVIRRSKPRDSQKHRWGNTLHSIKWREKCHGI